MMDARAKKALDGSIENWKGVRDGKRVENTDNCTLCAEYFGSSFSHKCDGCPVSKKTGLTRCNGTPYEKWRDHMYTHEDKVYKSVMCSTCYDIADKEVKFLESLKEPEITMKSGEVWALINGYAFIYENSDGELKYRYGSISSPYHLQEGIYTIEEINKKKVTRIFSLEDYKKGVKG